MIYKMRIRINKDLFFIFKLASTVFAFLCLTLAIAGFRYNIWPILLSKDVIPFLLALLQTLAGILAIAISFSLLYLQISVEAYSIRASQLLIRHPSFKRLVLGYVSVLCILGLLALFITDDPPWVSLAAGLLGLMLFLYGLSALIHYISDITTLITPESILDYLIDQFNRVDLVAEIADYYKSRSYNFQKGTFEPEYIYSDKKGYRSFCDFEVPRRPSEIATFNDAISILIDISKKMIVQSDRLALRETVNRLVDSVKPGYWACDKYLSNNPREGFDPARLIAASNSYFSGALLEI